MRREFGLFCATIIVVASCGQGPPKGGKTPVIVNTDGDLGGGAASDMGTDDMYLVPETCGDGELQAPEQCDGSMVPATCTDLGRGDGEVACTPDCRFDVGACEVATSCGGSWCDGELARSCEADGSVVTNDCAASGDRCAAGDCLSGCEAAEADGGHEGCHFVGAQLPNSQGGPNAMFVAVNVGTAPATVTFRNATQGITDTAAVAPGETALFETDADLDVVEIKSDQPIAVTQYNAPTHSASQDSSLLFPVHAWGTSTHVATWGGWEGAFYATLTPESAALTIDGSYVRVVDDPSGTHVSSDSPTLVIGGHECTSVITSYCDHLEHALFDDAKLGTEYRVAAIYEGETNVPQALKIVATEAATVQLAGSSAESKSLTAGEVWTLEFEEGLDGIAITADKPVAVAQIHGASRSPSMVALPHRGLWRRSYTISGSPSGEAVIQVIAPSTADLTVDGSAWTSWTPLPGTEDKVANIPVAEAGVARLESTEPVQAVVVGFYAYASFMHLGGFTGP